MTKRTDILLGGDGDLLITDGDFSFGESDEQHVEHIVVAKKGWYKQFAMLGIGIISYVKKQSNYLVGLKREAMINLDSDEYKLNSIDIDNSGKMNLDYEANYE